ncbi:MAG: NADH-quinone oxidoreductase subunit M [Gammaproteobacteria bacterium RIFCSPLOWO2_02_FULL_56_15]|nr:MAG: NADH-quinone oxidoreductase subunit M [Gammaproteobacteria bacterium RIFCSPLOWO2_02_FULL_56_15]
MFENLPLLSLVIWAPILGGIWVLYAGDRQEESVKYFSLAVTITVFVLSVLLLLRFDNSLWTMQFSEKFMWIEAFDIHYHLGIDGISLPLIVLTTFTTILVIIAAWEVIEHRISQYLAAFLILEGCMIGAFASLDAILFYVFWEAMLIPMFLIIGVWGGSRRVYATIKFFLYTFLGSVFMLIALLYLYSKGGSFEILAMHELPLSLFEQKLIFIAFLLAFAVKVPMWPVHTWLPDAHVEAPTGGSVILAAILLKMGGYGFLRFSLPITPDASLAFDDLMIGLSLIAIVYIGFVALAQQDMKKLIAYSSISHMGFVTLGFFTGFRILQNTGLIDGAVMGLEGGMMQMISHGFISGALFLCVGVMYERMHSREINDYGGVVNTMPVFAVFMMLFAMANSGLPGTSGFVGEFMVILSSFQASFWIAFPAASILILGAAYTLWMYKRVIFGEIANENVAELSDITLREGLFLGALAIMVLLFGVWPAPLFEIMQPTLEHLFEHVIQSKVG